MARYIDAAWLINVLMAKGKDKLRLATVINEIELAPKVDISKTKAINEGCLKAVAVDEDFESILVCTVRYACGRRTYMPSVVIKYIAPLLPQLSERTLAVFERDIADAGKFGGYGDEYIDKLLWMEFLECVRAEIGKRLERKETP